MGLPWDREVAGGENVCECSASAIYLDSLRELQHHFGGFGSSTEGKCCICLKKRLCHVYHI